MAIYEVSSPRGVTYEIEAPENANERTLKLFARHQDYLESQKGRVGMMAQTIGEEENRVPKNTMKDPEVSVFDQVTYGFDAGESDFRGWGHILEAKFPDLLPNASLGLINSVEDKYGADFNSLTENEKLQRIQQTRSNELKQDYKKIYEAGVQDSGWSMLGKIAGSLVSPTTLLPYGQSYKMITGISALYGAEYTFAHTRSRSKEEGFLGVGQEGWEDVAKGAAFAGVAGPTAVFVGRTALNFIKGVKDKASKAVSDEAKIEAKGTVKAVQDEIFDGQAKGLDDAQIRESVSSKLGKTEKEVLEDLAVAQQVSGETITKLTPVEQQVFKDIPDVGVTPGTTKGRWFLGDLFNSLSSAVERISPVLSLRLRQLDLNSHARVAEMQTQVKPFSKFLTRLSGPDKQTMKYHLLNGEFDEARKLISAKGSKTNLDDFNAVIKVFDDLHEELLKAGYKNLPKVSNYWHRGIKDMDGLIASLSPTRRSQFDLALRQRTAALVKKGVLKKGDKLPLHEQETFIANFLRARKRGITDPKLSATERRKTQVIQTEQLKFYEDPVKSLNKYIDEVIYDAERKKFFGGHALDNGDRTIDVRESAASLVRTLRESGKLNDTQLDDLQRLLEIRFLQGEKATGKIAQGFRNAGYATTLTNPFSAIIQLGDVGVSAFVNGFRNTLAGMVTKNKINMQQLGLDKILAEEFINERVMAKTLFKLFTWSGFRHVDRFGKNTILNAALRNGSHVAKRLQAGKSASKRGRMFANKYKEAFGPQYASLVDDLANGRITENVKLFLWSELSGMQPISLSEMPIKYLEMNSGRIFYTLKTYMTKQMDLIRRSTADTWAKGGLRNRTDAVRNAAAYLLIVPSGNAGVSYIRDMAMGKEIGVDEVPDRWVREIFKTFGASEYGVRRFLTEKFDVPGFVTETIAPPTDWMTDTGGEILDYFDKTDSSDPNWDKAIKHVPLVGKFYYYWMTPTGLDEFRDYHSKMQQEKYNPY